MISELVSKRTRNEFREFLVNFTLRQIESEFDSANIERDRDYLPDASGQRRSLVEQYYRTLNFTRPADVRRLLTAYASIIERAKGNLRTSQEYAIDEHSIAQLEKRLAKDGFAYADGDISPTTAEKRAAFEAPLAITEVTRRAIFNDFSDVNWSGQLDERAFLVRVCELGNPCHGAAIAGASQHRVRNWDWANDWVFTDPELNLIGCSDQFFLRFLCEVVHPVVRPDSTQARSLVATFNQHLVVDGWELVEGKPISGRPTFVPRRNASGVVALPEPNHPSDILCDEYVRELAAKCDSRLASADLEGAVTVARTLLEQVLAELELRLTGAKANHKGDLPRQFKQVTKLLNMDDQRSDLDDRFREVIRGLIMISHGLASLRNKMSDGHARERKPAPHHARVVVNAAKTVAAFLVESYTYQRDKGLVQDLSPAAEKVSA